MNFTYVQTQIYFAKTFQQTLPSKSRKSTNFFYLIRHIHKVTSNNFKELLYGYKNLQLVLLTS